jgi:multicomponent Na+:H+ antiporter subunit B
MELYILLAFMIIGSIAALEAKDPISSIINLGAVGLALCVTFLILKSPDLAITQLVVEMLCLVILIKATVNKDVPIVVEGRWVFNTISTFVFFIIFLAFAWRALKELPDFGAPLMLAVKENQGRLFISEVSDSRIYDTLGEIAILFVSVIGIMAIVREHGDKKDK